MNTTIVKESAPKKDTNFNVTEEMKIENFNEGNDEVKEHVGADDFKIEKFS